MYGLVLEGGGTRGAYQIGVYKALMEEEVDIAAIVGTSIGALNGAMLAQGDYEKARELWQNLNYSMIINMTEEELERLENLSFTKESLNFISNRIRQLISDNGLDISPLKEMIDENIDEDKIKRNGIEFGLVAVNLTDLKPVEIFLEEMEEGQLKSFLLASAYLPVFKKEKLAGKVYLDGGFYDNFPFQMLQKKGYEKLILVRVHANGVVKDIELDEDNHILIAPREDLGGTLECDPERSNYNMTLGYYDGLKALRSYYGEKYYIVPSGSEDDYFKKFLDFSPEKIYRLAKVMNEDNKNHRRLLFEQLIPKLAFYLGLDKDFGYKDVYLALIEYRMGYLGLERFKIYSEEELIELINDSELPKNALDDQGFLEKLKATVGSIVNLNRHELLLKSLEIMFKD